MRARVWGCRGSLAAPGPETVRYGGNTSCVEIRTEDGSLVVLDAGTGIRPLGLGSGLRRTQTVHLLLTHLHLDHIEGLGFFGPIWSPATTLHIWGPHAGAEARAADPPVLLAAALPGAAVGDPRRARLPRGGGRRAVGDRIAPRPRPARRSTRPDPRIPARGGRPVVRLRPRSRARAGRGRRGGSPEIICGHALAAGADLLFHDGQYTTEEYAHRIGWGHSAFTDAVHFARAADVGRLVLFHHDPNHSDAELDELLYLARAGSWDLAGEITLAYEGMEASSRDHARRFLTATE